MLQNKERKLKTYDEPWGLLRMVANKYLNDTPCSLETHGGGRAI